MNVFARLFGSTTFLSALFPWIVYGVAQRNGIEIPPELILTSAAAMPAAVGWKESARRRADADVEIAHTKAYGPRIEDERSGAVTPREASALVEPR